MNIIADTNVLVRSAVQDHTAQSAQAVAALKQASSIAIAMPALCEFVWVLQTTYGFSRADIAAAIRSLMGIRTVTVHRGAVEAGLAMLEAGADFADGVIAQEGLWLGGEVFVSFDRKATDRLKKQGRSVQLLA